MPSKFSDKAEPHYLRALAYEEAGRIQDAIREYRMANRIKKDLIPARKRLGDLYRRLGRSEEAIREYLKADEIVSQKRKWSRILLPDEEKFSRLQVLAALAETLEETGRSEEAREVRQRMLATPPDRPSDLLILNSLTGDGNDRA